jgi:hypothetical protein
MQFCATEGQPNWVKAGPVDGHLGAGLPAAPEEADERIEGGPDVAGQVGLVGQHLDLVQDLWRGASQLVDGAGVRADRVGGVGDAGYGHRGHRQDGECGDRGILQSMLRHG